MSQTNPIDPDISRGMLLVTLDAMSDGFIFIDGDNNVGLFNSRFKDIYGLSDSDCYPGLSYVDLLKVIQVKVLSKSLSRGDANNWLSHRSKNSARKIIEFDEVLDSGQLIRIRESKIDTGGSVVVHSEITEANKIILNQIQERNELAQLIDSANAPIFGIDQNGKVNEWNQTAERITGFSKDDVMGHDLVAEFITDDYKASVKAVLDEALAGQETANYEFPLYTKSGNRVDVLLNSSTRRDVPGNIVGVVGVGQDITELNKVRREQGRIASELTDLIDSANAPIFGIDQNGKVNEWNQTAERITGFSKDDVMGHDLVAEFITDDYKASVKAVLDEALAGQETANYEFPLYTKSGNRVDVLLNSSTRRDVPGNIVGVVGVGQDITELNKVRREQERIASELTDLIDSANAPIFGIDQNGKVNEWNQTAERITGFSKDDVMGHDLVAEFITDDYKASVKAVLDEALAGQETANYEFPLYTKSGNRVDVLLNSSTRRDVPGNIVGVVGVGQDITELKLTQAQVIHASKLATLGEMATSVAHELNQPLNVIRMASGNLLRKLAAETLNDEILESKLERIQSQTERAAAIIDHMRIFGRKTPEKGKSIKPTLVVQSALDLVGEQLRLAQIEVLTDFTGYDDNAEFSAHLVQLEQVIINLLTNARDAILDKGGKRKIEIKVDNSSTLINIFVIDSGGGIPNEIKSRVFEPFYTTKVMGKGTGLGLSVSYGIIQDNGGNISVDNVDGGASFCVSLPLAVGEFSEG